MTSERFVAILQPIRLTQPEQTVAQYTMKISRSQVALLLLASVLLFVPTRRASGAIFSRTMTSDGQWQQNNNWSGGQYPNNSRDNVFDAILPANRIVSGFISDITIRNFTLEGNASFTAATGNRKLTVEGGFTNSTSGILTLAAPIQLHLKGVSLFNGGFAVTDSAAGIHNYGSLTLNPAGAMVHTWVAPTGLIGGETASLLNDVGATLTYASSQNSDFGSAVFVNRGAVDIQGGHEKLGTFTQNTSSGSRLTVRSGAQFEASSAFNFFQGQVRGGGTVKASTITFGSGAPVWVSAGVNDGDRGTLTFDAGSKTVTSLTLHVDLASAVSFDKLVVNGAGTFSLNNATLSMTSIGGYVPGISDSYEIISGSGLSGMFSNAYGVMGNSGKIDLIGGTFDVTVSSGSVTLANFVAVPEPSTYALLGLAGAVMVIGRRFRRR